MTHSEFIIQIFLASFSFWFYGIFTVCFSQLGGAQRLQNGDIWRFQGQGFCYYDHAFAVVAPWLHDCFPSILIAISEKPNQFGHF